MQTRLLIAALISLALHALLAAWVIGLQPPSPVEPEAPKPLQLSVAAEPAEKPITNPDTNQPAPRDPPPPSAKPLQPARKTPTQEFTAASQAAPSAQAPASMAAPPPPTADEWQMAGTYTLKNSKRYRYNWGQQVRSMMGTAVEGPQQGYVRFRIEIAPDGKLARIDTLWSTSEHAEKLARQAIAAMPPLPPTPTGQALVFEQTIAFVPFESGWPPIYKNDCLPDPPAFKNPFVWDGKSPLPDSRVVSQRPAPTAKPAANPDCPSDAQPDSLEAEAADIKRQLDFWGALPLNGVK